VGLSLVALDTDHIKGYVFATDKLKEIRGASSILDRLNRWEMEKVAGKLQARSIYTNGGAGLFVVDADKAQAFKLRIQELYREKSKGRASITGVIQELPDDAPDDIEALMRYNLKRPLDLMRYRLRVEKDSPPDVIAPPSHPFMRPCDSCGTDYAEHVQPEPGGRDTFYCASCLEKQEEDGWIKSRISDTVRRIIKGEWVRGDDMWGRILRYLQNVDYSFPDDPNDIGRLDRPDDFNEFSQFAETKDYLGLIYADANNMGAESEKQGTLRDLKDFATGVDGAIHQAMSQAIKRYLPIARIRRDGETIPVFPFDILLLGGDDVVMVTDAAKAMHVALAIAQEFRSLTKNKYDLSVGVVLAPIKYPFGLLQDLAESALKFAKKDGARAKDGDKTRINFFKLTGGSEPDFKDVYNELYHRKDEQKGEPEFYATLRPYTVQNLRLLLDLLAEGRKMNLGRTKLHQLREAVLEKNLTTSVQQALAALLNWRGEQRFYVAEQVYEFGQRAQVPRSNPRDPLKGFPRVTFPWFADGKSDEGRDVYRTSLLDFIELYDLVTREGEDSGD